MLPEKTFTEALLYPWIDLALVRGRKVAAHLP